MANGTIVLQNLLYDPGPGVILQVTCNETVGQYRAFNLYDKNLNTPCHIDAQSTAYINFLFSTPVLVYGVILVNHNIDVAGNLAFQSADNPGFSNPVTDPFSSIQQGKNAFFIKSTGYYYSSYRVKIEANQVVGIGQAFLLGCFPYTFEKNFDKPIRTTYQPGKIGNTTYYGSDISETRYQKPRKQLTFSLIKPNQHNMIVEAFNGEYFIFDPYGNNYHEAKFCKFESLQTEEIQGEGYTRFNLSLEYTEQPIIPIETISVEPPGPPI